MPLRTLRCIPPPLFSLSLLMRLIFWNCQGAGSGGFIRTAKEYIREERPDVMMLAEPRISGTKADRVCRKFAEFSCKRIEAQGFSRGIWVWWNSLNVNITVIDRHPQAFHLKVTQGRHEWYLTVIYACPRVAPRCDLWQFLADTATAVHGPWAVIAGLRVLPRIKSDHHPIRLLTDGQPRVIQGSRPFRYLAAWNEHPDFNRLLSSTWDNTLELPSNLQTFRDHVQLWNKEVFGHILGRKRRLLARLQGVQRAIHTRPHRHLRELEESLSKDLEDILAQKEILWFQKSRTEWVNSGDRNTKYFHTKAVAKRRKIRIETLLDSDGRWITDTTDLAALATRHLRTLFTDDRDMRLVCDVLERFCQASGEKVSATKTSIFFSRNVVMEDREAICRVSSFAATNTLGSYLGVQLVHGRVSKEHFSQIIHQVQARLNGWASKSLSMAGRITLAKSVIQAMPSYAMHTMQLPVLGLGIPDQKVGSVGASPPGQVW
ncbi:hypothetical protein CRG98_028200 [Punica granatum]|uniref:Reverse transcriptase domain-containing protein n=1 Tax=Punica granatum TaxID=22663 RepID=A0A2I0J597_PUNGR|nr:hypothetical protein CRG98_028200 [Punica granatum]